MENNIGIGIQAQLDTQAVERQINALGQKIAQANKVQFKPISNTTTADVERIVKQFDQLRKIHGELNRRMAATGQGNSTLFDLDWDRLYVDPSVRARQMRKVFEYTTGSAFITPPETPSPGRGGGGQGGDSGGGGSAAGSMAAQVTQAGLRSAGPAGGVAANALSTGMSAGFGAGLMGLLGGMLALGVGKLVSGVMEKIEQAESNNIAMDRLKRTLGDVNVSFNALKSVVHAGADNLKITYAESEKLATQFAKLGNVTGTEYKGLADELGVGVGMSRAFGLDPSQGVGVMGQMRGLGITTNTQESRRFALLIGETIGKSGAFAKADEVMDALASFAASQTRNNMSAANVAGYAGMFSSMVGSGIPGLDPQGAAGLLARVNSALSSGGAKGEASQFFTGLVGTRMGLDPIQTQILREGGAFATNSSMFGEGSVARRYGISGPDGDKTFLQSSLEELRRQYGSNKGLLAQATANHLGVGINQAMALLSIEPNAIGEMQDKFGDLSKLSATGIGNISTALYGSSDDRQALARSLKARSDVTAADKEAITAAEGDDSKLRDVLAELSARYGQERTMGSDIRDSKNALDNIKTAIADQLVPMTNQIRMGIMHIAGKGEKSSEQVMREVIELDSKERQKSIKGEYDTKINPLQDSLGELGLKRRSLDPVNLAHTYRDRPEILAQKMAERAEVERQIGETERKIAKLQEERADLLKKENERRANELVQMEKDAAFRAREELKPPEPVGSAPSVPGNQSISRRRAGRSRSGTYYRSPGAGEGGEALSSGVDTSAIDEKLTEAERANGLPPGTMRAVMQQEIGGRKEFLSDPSKYHYGLNAQGKRVAPHTGQISTAFGPFGILESTAADPGYGVSPLKNKSLDEQIRFTAEYLAARARSAGSLEAGLAGYGEGPRYSAEVMARIRSGSKPAQQSAAAVPDGKAPPVGKVERGPDLPAPAKAEATAPEVSKRSTPLPAASSRTETASAPSVGPLSGEMSVRLDLSPEARRLLQGPAAPLTTRFGPPTPFGATSAW